MKSKKYKKYHALYLVKDRGKRGLLKILFSRIGIILLLILLQILFFVSLFQWFNDIIPHLYILSLVFSYLIVIYIVNNKMNSTAKITWIIFILAFPIFGGLLYAYTQSNLGHRLLARRVTELISLSEHKLTQTKEALETLKNESEDMSALAYYLKSNGNYPVYNRTSSVYFPTGNDKFIAMLEALEKAKHFIFLEYFIIQEGEMWGRILEVLARKAAEGVEVRVLYDGTNTLTKVPFDYDKRLESLGIKCKIHAPISPFISTHYNYRDHRKILVIDGHTAFNGGINLADEYININSKFGYWKDTAVMLKGDAVKSFTLMFLQLWNIDEKDPKFDQYLDATNQLFELQPGFVIPYGDEPLDDDKVGQSVYIDILNRAKQYVHIMTPYLILDGEMENALKFAARRGVKVRIIMPGIADKQSAYALAKTYYASLMSAGVEIFEYTPGFIHAKVFVSDDHTAVVGTINLDYRSLYHHFECGTLLYKTDSIRTIEEDFQDTLAASHLVTLEDLKKRPLWQKLFGSLLRLVAPLM